MKKKSKHISISYLIMVLIMLVFINPKDYKASAEMNNSANLNVIALKPKENISIEGLCEFYIDSTKIAHRIDPLYPVNYYTYYETDMGKQYVDVCIAYKNMAFTPVRADSIGTCVITFAGEYNYNCFTVIESDNRGNFAYSNITNIDPLMLEYVHFMSNVPEEIVNSNGEITATLNIGNHTYTITIRDGETGQIIAPNPQAIEISSGNIEKAEIIYIPGICEFDIESTTIAPSIAPPNHGQHYLACDPIQGKQYIDVCFKYKSFAKTAQRVDSLFYATLFYDTQYQFNGYPIFEEHNRSNFNYANISYVEALTPEYIHYIFEVPNEVATSNLPLSISFRIQNTPNTYDFKIR